MRIGRRFCVVSVVVALAGCANLDSIYRPLEIRGSAVAVDAKQRGIYSVQRDGSTVVCPEPSPDALSAYAASGGITGLIKSATEGTTPSGQLQAAFAAGEQTGSIGLRTQSIQLLRDGLFATCLGYMNQALGTEQYYALMRRSQNFTLGLLAIEQLTGAVKADQVKLSSSSAASTGSDNVDKELAAVDGAQKAVNDAKTAQETSQGNLVTAKKAEDKSKADLDAAKKNQASLPAGATGSDLQKLKDSLDAAQSDFDAKHADTITKQAAANGDDRSVKDATKRLDVANDQLSLAQGRVRASASGSADFIAAQSRAQVAQHISEAVTKIVANVLTESGRQEACIEATARWEQDPSSQLAQNAVNAVCSDEKRVAAVASAAATRKIAIPDDFLKVLPPDARSKGDLYKSYGYLPGIKDLGRILTP